MHSSTHHYRGYVIRRGGYQGTADDSIDRWYIDHADADTLDRRGPGYRTLADARTGIDRHTSHKALTTPPTRAQAAAFISSYCDDPVPDEELAISRLVQDVTTYELDRINEPGSADLQDRVDQLIYGD